MEVTRETDFSIVKLSCLEFPRHKYWELVEHLKEWPGGNINHAMFYRLTVIYEAFRHISVYANRNNLFLVKFKLILPRVDLIPPDIRPAYFDFFKSYEKLEYKTGKDLNEQVELILQKLFTLMQFYKYLFPEMIDKFPISEYTTVSDFQHQIWDIL